VKFFWPPSPPYHPGCRLPASWWVCFSILFYHPHLLLNIHFVSQPINYQLNDDWAWDCRLEARVDSVRPIDQRSLDCAQNFFSVLYGTAPLLFCRCLQFHRFCIPNRPSPCFPEARWSRATSHTLFNDAPVYVVLSRNSESVRNVDKVVTRQHLT
jgi:hypothetical protein